MKYNLLWSKSIDLNANLTEKNTETSRLMFDQISGSCSLAKLTHKINYCNYTQVHVCIFVCYG